jgi:uncharacterized membrane-anchored protein YjiN (DUF445 family)
MVGSGTSSRSDKVRRERLRRNRTLATLMLAGMGAIYVGTRMVPQPGFLTLLVQSGAEAGMVGGLADWFAVTALFRHPLGVPIPHTAIIPTSKERIGRTLGRFVESNFLTPDVLLGKLRQMQVGRRVADWLAAPPTAPLLAYAITSALPFLIRSMRNRDLHDFVQRSFGDHIAAPDLAPILGHGVHLITASGEADALFDHAIKIAIQWLADHHEHIDKLISEHSRWWIPKAIDRRIAAALIDGVTEVLTGLKQADSEARAKFRDGLAGVVDDLLHSPEQREQINGAAKRLLAHPDTRAWLASIWNQLCDAALADLAEPESRLRVSLEKPISLLAQTLATDAVMQQHIDEAVERLARSLITWRTEIGSFIAEVVRNWDAHTLTERLELAVGSDLQYIRMNGTIVGACAGCLIFLLTWTFG